MNNLPTIAADASEPIAPPVARLQVPQLVLCAVENGVDVDDAIQFALDQRLDAVRFRGLQASLLWWFGVEAAA